MTNAPKHAHSLPQELLVGFAPIQRGVMFPRHKPHGLYLELAHDVTKFSPAVAPYLPIVSGLSQIARKDNEIRLLVQTIGSRGGHPLSGVPGPSAQHSPG
jgi:hypothetical protein